MSFQILEINKKRRTTRLACHCFASPRKSYPPLCPWARSLRIMHVHISYERKKKGETKYKKKRVVAKFSSWGCSEMKKLACLRIVLQIRVSTVVRASMVLETTNACVSMGSLGRIVRTRWTNARRIPVSTEQRATTTSTRTRASVAVDSAGRDATSMTTTVQTGVYLAQARLWLESCSCHCGRLPPSPTALLWFLSEFHESTR